MINKLYIKAALFSLIVAIESFAQFGSGGLVDARSMGMAKTSASIVRGINSIGLNPANLMLEHNKFSISSVLPIPSASFRTGTDFISINDFNYFFGGVDGRSRILTETDKNNLNNLFEDGGLVFANAYTNLLSISFKPSHSFGSIAFSISDFAGGKMNIPHAIVDLALSGNEQNKIYSMNDAEIKSWWIRNYSLSYSREAYKNIFAGISLKLIHGFSYVGTEKMNTSFNTSNSYEISGSTDNLAYTAFSDAMGVNYDFDSTDTESSYGLFIPPAGTGFGFDFGLTALTDNGWAFSFAATDIGSIKWDKNAAEFTSFGSIYLDDVTDQAQRDSLEDKISGSGKRISGFSTGLSTALRFGASKHFDYGSIENPRSILLAVDYNQGLNNLPGNSLTPRFSIGAEWKPGNWIPYFRTGFSFGGADGFNWALGLGVDAGILELDFATSDMQAVAAPNSARYISVAVGSRWKF